MYSQPDTGGLSKDEIRQAFREFDLDRNGYVGAAEIAHVLASMGEKVTDDEIDEMILMADTDGDGQISFDEFHKLMYQLSGKPLAQNRGGLGMQAPPHMQGRGQAPYGQPPNMALNRGGYQQGQQNFGGGGYGGPPHMDGDYGGQRSMGGGYGVGVGSGGAGAVGVGGDGLVTVPQAHALFERLFCRRRCRPNAGGDKQEGGRSQCREKSGHCGLLVAEVSGRQV